MVTLTAQGGADHDLPLSDRSEAMMDLFARRARRGTLASLLAVACVATGTVGQAESVEKIDVTEAARRIGLQSGRPTVLLLYATTCSLSQEMFPRFVELADEYQARGVTFLVFSTDQPKNAYWIPEFLAQNKASFSPVMIRPWPSGDLGRALRTVGIHIGSTWTRPLVVVIDRDGRVVMQTNGETDLSPLRSAIARVTG